MWVESWILWRVVPARCCERQVLGLGGWWWRVLLGFGAVGVVMLGIWRKGWWSWIFSVRNVGGEWEVGGVAFGVRGSNIPIYLKGIFRTKQKHVPKRGKSEDEFPSFFPNFRGMGYVTIRLEMYLATSGYCLDINVGPSGFLGFFQLLSLQKWGNPTFVCVSSNFDHRGLGEMDFWKGGVAVLLHVGLG